MRSVNEGDAVEIDVTPFDSNGQAVAPTTARYRLDDKTTGNSLIAWTAVATTATEMTVSIPSSANAIINTNLAEEVKVLTFQTEYGTDDQQSEEIEYSVNNLQFIS